MIKRLRAFAPGLTALSAILAGGCGGGGASSGGNPAAAVNSTRGAVSVSLQFAGLPAGRLVTQSKETRGVINPPSAPPYAGNIPYGAFAVKVTLTNPTTGAALAPSRLVIAPQAKFGIQPLVNIQYAALPVGPARVDVAAFPNHDGTGSLLATGSATARILPLQTVNVAVPMALTVKRVVAFPSSVSLSSDGDSTNIATAAQDSSNNAVDFPLMALSADPDIADVFLSASNSATISSGSRRGTTEIAVYEPNSGLFAIVKVEVD